MLLIDKESSKNLYTQLYEGLKQQILSGELPTGFILPATRKMAQEYELSRNTVITAYRQLEVEGTSTVPKVPASTSNPCRLSPASSKRTKK